MIFDVRKGRKKGMGKGERTGEDSLPSPKYTINSSSVSKKPSNSRSKPTYKEKQ